ncbi:metalloprotease [Theileria orientalis]|uniref:CAAX prenyl protease n=1 Tax=Theileria orientalis TaxID=68886 RepID=A0A976QRS2_THEOR|nr:metalloprotease [Theileria orientalis]
MIISYMRNECLNNRFLYGCDITASQLVSLVSEKSQANTQISSKRPFGVGLLVAGYDEVTGLHLYETCPSGNVVEFNATAFGARCQSAKTYLEKKILNFPESDLNSLVYHAIRALKTTIPNDGEFDVDVVSVGVVGKGTPWNLLDQDMVKKYVDKSLAFCGFKLLFDTVVDLPFSLYSDFVLEEKHGFNKKTYKLFLKDLLITLSLEVGLGGPFLAAVIFLVNWGGELFYFYVFGFIVVFNFIMIVIYPELIAPLFNKFEPLHDQELKEDIETLAKKLKFPLREIKQMDGSKRSGHSNAYFYGLWKFKKIVVYDTILNQDRKEILAVVSHELGHWKHKDFYTRVSFSFVNIFAMFFVFKKFKDDKNMYNSFGFHGVDAFVIGITLFSNVFTLVGILTNFLNVLMTRYQEYKADRFAVNLGLADDLIKSLVNLHKDNKAMIYNDPVYSWYHYTHPVLFERIYAIYQALDKYKK